jgi:hypothetical protein
VSAHHLALLQRLLVDAVRIPSPIPADDDFARGAEALIKRSPRGMTPAERLEVYREQFWLRHWTNLEDDYPTLIWALGGSDAFRALVVQYLHAHPPRTWNLQELGADLPRYLAGHDVWRGDELVRDAARLDWAFVEAFDAPDAPPLDARLLASTPEDSWPSARVSFHPSVRPLELNFPLHELRDSLKRGDTLVRPARAVARVLVLRDQACFLHAIGIDREAYDLLVSLRDGETLGAACEKLSRALPSGESAALGERVGTWFQGWTARGLISSVRFDEPH